MKRFLLLAFVLASLACESTPTVPVETLPRDVTAEMVTGAALAALRSDGTFQLPLPAAADGQLPLDTARAQSLEFAKYVTNTLLLRGVVESGRGGYWTDPHLLTHCLDAIYVRAQLAPVPSDSIPPATWRLLARLVGPQWLLTFCGSQRDPQMTVQAALDGNDIRFADGRPVEPYQSLASAWYANGVPLNWPDALTLSAERAVRFAWETLHTRVTSVPELFARGSWLGDGRYAMYQSGSARYCLRWRLELEADVVLRGMTTLRHDTTQVVFVGPLTCGQQDVLPALHLPLAEQPATVAVDYLDTAVNPPISRQVPVSVVSPVRFEFATAVSSK